MDIPTAAGKHGAPRAAAPPEARRAALQTELQALRREVLAQIASYPPPIAGCDQQFNHLLAQREALAQELRRLAALDASAPDAPAALDAFVRASAFIGPASGSVPAAARRPG